MITLTLEEIKRAARDYYDAGMLTAQDPNPENRVCVNLHESGRRCAVAAALPEDLVKKYPIGGLNIFKGEIEFKSKEDYAEAFHIQATHDQWAIASKEEFENDAEFFKTELLKLIDHPSVT